MRTLFKQRIREIFNAFGFDIYKKGQYRRDMYSFLNYISGLGFKPNTVIDVGAAYGTFELYDNFPNGYHFLIEPLYEYEGFLKNIRKKYGGEYVLAAAGDKNETIEINVHRDIQGSSFLKETEGSHVDGILRKVPMKRIDDLCKQRNLLGPYLIKIDTQGGELLCLNGAKDIIEDTEVIILEVQLYQFFINGPIFDDVVRYMKKCSFVVYDIFNHHYRPLDSALASVDMAFVKEDGQFRKSHCYATLKQREELNKKVLQ